MKKIRLLFEKEYQSKRKYIFLKSSDISFYWNKDDHYKIK